MKTVSRMLAVSLLLACAVPLIGQTSRGDGVGTLKAARTKKSTKKKSAKAQRSEKGTERRHNWTFFASLSNVFDSNIEHDPVPVRSYGLVPALGVSYRREDESSRNAFAMDYEVAGRSYTHTNKWDVVSHNLDLAYRRSLPRH